MNAAVLHGVDQPLVLEQMEQPEPAAGEVLVRLKASALNHRDCWIQKGQYAGLRFPIVLGSDGAGLVAALGAGVDRYWLGKEVIIDPSIDWGNSEAAQQKKYEVLGLPRNGCFAAYVTVPAVNLHTKPAHLNWQQAAALPLAGITAFRALFTRGRLQKNDQVLITGIGGGVALMALQWAVAAGAMVYVTSSNEAKLAKAKTLGAVGTANYTQADWHKQLLVQSGGFNLIIDSAGGDDFAKLIDLAKPGGSIVFYGGTNGTINHISPQKIFWKQLNILGSTMGSPKDFATMLSFCEQHQIIPIIDEVFPLAQAQQAFQKMAAGRQMGKLVLVHEA
jgi:zinc-binding alcohol dehydrogenase/oxidoreductase